ncbi:MAG: hypothetical protein Q9223_006702 [Gallowayella weberi]
MKPAPLPTRPPGETLKYASAAAAAAAASDKNSAGIAPLPPPPNAALASSTGTIPSGGLNPAQPTPAPRSTSPNAVSPVPASVIKTSLPAVSSNEVPPALSAQAKSPEAVQGNTTQADNTPSLEKVESQSLPPPVRKPSQHPADDLNMPEAENVHADQPPTEHTNGDVPNKQEEDESIYHLPPGLQDLIQSFEATKSRASSTPSASVQRLLGASHATCPEYLDAERPKHYRPQTKYNTPRCYPQEPLITIDDPALYSKIDTDTLFYIFYYRQNTYQQYMAAKSLKNQSWRFHKQYQTWFQRHEEPKTITEEYEQGTYRFFDYESTWLMRASEQGILVRFPANDLAGHRNPLQRRWMPHEVAGSQYNRYFLPGWGISRNILFSHIHFFLGPYATARPFSYQGREGYLVTTPGPPLTEKQIEDLQNLSRQYEQQAAERMVVSQGQPEEDAFINRPIRVQQQRRYPPNHYPEVLIFPEANRWGVSETSAKRLHKATFTELWRRLARKYRTLGCNLLRLVTESFGALALF